MAPLPIAQVAMDAQAQTSSPSFKVTKSDYETEVDEIFGSGSLAYLVLEDSGRSIRDARGIVPVNITSDEDPNGFEIDLLETGIGTGVFIGAIGFEKGGPSTPQVDVEASAEAVFGRSGKASGDPAKIHVEDGSEVTVKTLGSSSRTQTVVWRESHTAEFIITHKGSNIINGGEPFQGNFVNVNPTVTFQVKDKTLNQASGSAESYDQLLRVWSRSDREGEFITIEETGSDTDRFQATIRFEDSLTPENGRIFVKDGDWVKAEFLEEHDASGDTQTHSFPQAGSWEFNTIFQGSILLDREGYFGETQSGGSHGSNLAIVFVGDAGERNNNGVGPGSLPVQACAMGDFDEDDVECNPVVPVTVTQNQGSGATFIGELGFGGCSGCLDLQDGEEFVVIYEDSSDGRIVDTAVWHQTGSASRVAILKPEGPLFGTDEEYTVRVEDIDANRDDGQVETVTVWVKTDSDPITGLEITLSETGAPAGAFEGSFRFTTDPTGSGRVEVSDGDVVRVEYRDEFSDDGDETSIWSSQAVWREAVTAEISTDAEVYYKQLDEGGDIVNRVEVLVEDLSRSVPNERNEIEVTARYLDASVETTLTLREIGTNTGIFHGSLGFGSGLPDAGSETTFEFRYEQADGTIVSSEAITLLTEPSETELRLEQVYGDATWLRPVDTLPVSDDCQDVTVSLYGFSGSSPVVTVTSDDDDHDVTLSASDGPDSRFTGTLTIGTSSTCNLEVTEDDTITAEYSELTVSATTRSLDDEEISFRNLDGQTIDEVSGENTPVELRVLNSRFGRNSAFREVEIVELSGDADEAIQVWTVETGSGSEVFTGGFLFTTEADSIEEKGRIAVNPDLTIMAYNNDLELQDVSTEVEATVGDTTATLDWYPADTAELTVTGAWGLGTSAPFRVTLKDGDGLSDRITETRSSDSDQRTYNFAQGPYVHGSELVSFADSNGDFDLLDPLAGTCQDAGSTSASEYERRTNGIRLCGDPADDRDMIFSYVRSQRTIRLMSDTGDEISAILNFDSRDGAQAVFKGNVRAALSSDDAGRIEVAGEVTQVQFLYDDPVTSFMGRSGSDESGHLLSIEVEQEWRKAENADVRIMKPDFSGSASGKVYGPVPVEVRDIDSSTLSRIDPIEVEIKGAATGKGVIWETGPNTGVFRGVIGVTSGSGSEIRAEYKDPRSSTGAANIPRESSRVDWEAAETGLIQICDTDGDCGTSGGEKLFQGLSDRFYVRITDADWNTDSSSAQSIKAQLISGADRVGKEISLSETSTDSGIFESGEIRFSTTPTTASNRLFVEDEGDRGNFWVDYEDPIDEDGKNAPITSTDQNGNSVKGIWSSVTDGRVSFDREIHIGKTPGDTDTSITEWVALEKMAIGILVIDDPQLNEFPKKVERLEIDESKILSNGFEKGEISFADVTNGESSLDLDGLELRETGHNTGIFVGTFTFGSGGLPNFGFAAENFVTFKATYSPDPSISAGSDPQSEASAEWFTEGFGVVTFDRSGYNDLNDRPRVTVYDADLNSTSLSVDVVSEAAPNGISVNLSPRSDVPEKPTDDNKRGVYTGTFRLSTSSSSSSLHVGDEDTIEARYTDTSPDFPGERIDTAVIGIGDILPPETTFVTDPAAPDGENDWFVTAPEVSFETDKSADRIDKTLYQINGGGQNELEPGETFTLSEGIHEITFWSVDVFDNEESEQTVEIKVSLTVPEGEVEDLDAEARPDGEVELIWTGVTIEGPAPLAYHIYRGPEGAEFGDDDVVRVGNSTEESHSDRPESEDPPQRGETFQYFVVVANEAGQESEDIVGIEGLSDRVAPKIDSFEVDVTELHEDEGEDTANAELTVVNEADNLADLHNITLRVLDPFGDVVHESEMEEDGSVSYSASYSGFDTCGVYNLLGVARDAVGNEDTGNRSVRYVAIDTSPPQLRDVVSEIQQGQSLNVTVVDNCAGMGSIEYSIGGGDRRTVNVPDRSSGDNCNVGPCTVSFQISASRFEIGDNQVTFYLADANATANEAVISRTIRMVELDDDDGDDELTAPSIDTDSFTSLVEHGGEFVFSVSGSGLSRLTFDGTNVLGGLGSGGQVRVDVSDYEAGQHTVTVRVENLLGDDRHEFTFYVLDEGIPLPPINVQVTKNDLGQPVVSWQDNPDRKQEIGGFIVHRAASPWRVIGIVDADTTSYTDLTAVGKTSYQYAVTSYGTGGQGLLAEGEDSEESLPWFQGVRGTTFETDDIRSGIPPIVWWVALVAVAVLLVVGLIYANRRQIFGRREEELYTEDYPDEAETPFGEERHLIECPNCSTEFHVTGERPVVTNCPNCGRKGILR